MIAWSKAERRVVDMDCFACLLRVLRVNHLYVCFAMRAELSVDPVPRLGLLVMRWVWWVVRGGIKRTKRLLGRFVPHPQTISSCFCPIFPVNTFAGPVLFFL